MDRAGAPAVATGATALFLSVLGIGLAFPPAGLPILPVFVAFMVANSTRNVSMNTLATQVSAPAERARFLSAQSAVQHLAAAAGAALSPGAPPSGSSPTPARQALPLVPPLHGLGDDERVAAERGLGGGVGRARVLRAARTRDHSVRDEFVTLLEARGRSEQAQLGSCPAPQSR